jgi:HSP20 family molecular chaperone IbpA
MTRLMNFSSPFLLGFDQIERALDRLQKSAGDAYPPYNVEQLASDTYRITLAVAGFSPAELSVTVDGNELLIRGKQAEDGNRNYVYRGIAARQFQRAFVLLDGIEVKSAELSNGLLAIDLRKPKPESTIKTVPITLGGVKKTSSNDAPSQPEGPSSRQSRTKD